MVKLVAQLFFVVAYATELTWLASTSDARTLAYVHLMLSNDLPTLFSFQRFSSPHGLNIISNFKFYCQALIFNIILIHICCLFWRLLKFY